MNIIWNRYCTKNENRFGEVAYEYTRLLRKNKVLYWENRETDSDLSYNWVCKETGKKANPTQIGVIEAIRWSAIWDDKVSKTIRSDLWKKCM